VTAHTAVTIGNAWTVEKTEFPGETYWLVLYCQRKIAEVLDENGTWSVIYRPRRDDPPIPAVVFAAVPHNEGLLRGLLYT
jgi:hypothetical protein